MDMPCSSDGVCPELKTSLMLALMPVHLPNSILDSLLDEATELLIRTAVATVFFFELWGTSLIFDFEKERDERA